MERKFLADGDNVVMAGFCQGARTHPRTLSQAFPRAPEWREHNREMDDEDYMVTIAGLVCIGFILVLAWLGY